MDYESYDTKTNETDAIYSAFVEWLSELTATELREAKGNLVAQNHVLCRYYKRGQRANLTAGELIDFLAVSTPSILDMAGYSEEEGDTLVEISA